MSNKTTTFARQILIAFFVMAVLTVSQSQEETTTEQQENCPKFCTKEYNPVCAAFGESRKTFPNPCSLKAEECVTGNSGYTFLHAGRCIDD